MLSRTFVKEKLSFASPHFQMTMTFNIERHVNNQTDGKWRTIAF